MSHHFEGLDGEVISTLRLMEEHPRGEKVFRIGRVCTKKSARCHGHTNRLLQAALANAREYPCHINAQTYLEEMYVITDSSATVRNSSTTASRTCPWSSRDVTGLSVQRHRRPGPATLRLIRRPARSAAITAGQAAVGIGLQHRCFSSPAAPIGHMAHRGRRATRRLRHRAINTNAPTPAALDALGRKYRPFRTVVAWYCWQTCAHPETLSPAFSPDGP
jgi:hypothetical protein